MRVMMLLLFVFIVWGGASRAHDWTQFVDVHGDVLSSEVTEGTYYLGKANATIWLPYSAALFAGCIKVHKTSNDAGKVRVRSEGGTRIGPWPEIALQGQEDWTEVCSDGQDYFQAGGRWPIFGLHFPQRTFKPGNPINPGNDLAAKCTYRMNPGDKIIRVSQNLGLCNGTVILITPAVINHEEGGYAGGYAEVCILALDMAPPRGPGGWGIWIHGNGHSIDRLPFGIWLWNETEMACLFFDGVEWFTRPRKLYQGG